MPSSLIGIYVRHSGQDAAGVVTCGSGGRFYQVKANGMVRDVFDEAAVAGLKGWMGIGHGEHLVTFIEGPLSDL